MKLVINNKDYEVCDFCGTFKSCEKCHNCHPYQIGDSDIHPTLLKYYDSCEYKQMKETTVKHHLLEYYFTKKQLIGLGLYYNVPDWQLLETTNSKHHRVIGGYKLHRFFYKDYWEQYKNMTEEQIRELINNIPKSVIEAFKN